MGDFPFIRTSFHSVDLVIFSSSDNESLLENPYDDASLPYDQETSEATSPPTSPTPDSPALTIEALSSQSTIDSHFSTMEPVSPPTSPISPTKNRRVVPTVQYITPPQITVNQNQSVNTLASERSQLANPFPGLVMDARDGGSTTPRPSDYGLAPNYKSPTANPNHSSFDRDARYLSCSFAHTEWISDEECYCQIA